MKKVSNKKSNQVKARQNKALLARPSRKEIEKKVQEGTQKAIKDFAETFRILARYDRS